MNDKEKNGLRSVDLEFGSIHSVKGRTHLATLVLETYYYNHNMTAILPYLCNSDSNKKIKTLDRKRLRCHYVAMTRAKKELFISRAQERFQYWEYVRNPESRFLSEISSDFIQNYDMSSFWFNKIFWNTAYEIQEHVKNPFKVKKTIVENDVSDFSVWDKLTHPKFWTGFITSMTNDLAEIAFSWYWIKKMNIKIAPVKKI